MVSIFILTVDSL